MLWQFNPFTGTAYAESLKDNPHAERLIHLPDCSYWEAMGLYHPRVDGSVKLSHEGVWINGYERSLADDDTELFTPKMAESRLPIFSWTVPNYQAVKRSTSHTPGEASSKESDVKRRKTS